MKYRIKEIFYSLQGEGCRAGRPAVFVRFAGCNLWDGLEEDRGSAACRFCDTDFRDGQPMFAHEIANEVARLWPGSLHIRPLVILTGGEPALQADNFLVSELLGYQDAMVAIETNGTKFVPDNLDWVTVSPKAGTEMVVHRGDELKLVYPQEGLDPESLEHLDFHHFFLQPMDGPDLEANMRAAVAYCLAHPRWRLSLQIHKLLGLR